MPCLPPEVALQRMYSRCIPNSETGCIEWTGLVQHKGYGMVRFGGKMRTVHRVAYEQMVGPIPGGAQVLHRCDNTRCCNKDHLFLGSNDDNMLDKTLKGRAAKKLTKQQVIQIIEMLEAGNSQKSLAARFGVHSCIVSRIRSGKRWARVHDIGGTVSVKTSLETVV